MTDRGELLSEFSFPGSCNIKSLLSYPPWPPAHSLFITQITVRSLVCRWVGWSEVKSSEISTTRNSLTFVNTTAIAYIQKVGRSLKTLVYAIAVVFTNVRELRVENLDHCSNVQHCMPTRSPA